MILNRFKSARLLSILKNLLMYLLLAFTIIGICINFILLFKYIYYLDIKLLDLENISGLNFNKLKTNYDYLVKFLYSNSNNFSMPYFPASPEGKIHFFEVRNIIRTLNYCLCVTLPISIFYILKQLHSKNLKFLKWTSILLCAIPVILLFPLAINFSKSFDVFHYILFNNDYWIFDETLDPVITVLPQKFFLHEGIFLLFTIFIISIILYFIYRKNKRSS